MSAAKMPLCVNGSLLEMLKEVSLTCYDDGDEDLVMQQLFYSFEHECVYKKKTISEC